MIGYDYDAREKEAVERCHELGIAVFVWTVNRVEIVRGLDALGVDGVITDDPRVLPS